MLKIIAVNLLGVLVLINCTTAQNCPIQELNRKFIDFSNFGLILKDYNDLEIANENTFKIVLIKFSNLSSKKLSYWLLISPNKKINIKVESEDSIFCSKAIDLTSKYNSEIFLNEKWRNGSFVCQCDKPIDTHDTEILIVCNNALNMRTEFVSMGGNIRKALSTNEKYTGLNEIYELMTSIIDWERICGK